MSDITPEEASRIVAADDARRKAFLDKELNLAEWVELLHRCQDGEASCMYVAHKIEHDLEREAKRREWLEGPPRPTDTREDLETRNRYMIMDQCEDEITIEKLCEGILTYEQIYGDRYGANGNVERVRFLAEKITRLRAALEDIRTTAHCIAKAGPLHTPTLQDAWAKFNQISVAATVALSRKAD